VNNRITDPGQADLARVAMAILFCVAASIWLVKEVGVGVAMFRWLAIVMVAGLIMNSQTGLPARRLLIGGSLCGLMLVGGSTFQAFVICRAAKPIAPPFMSGINLCAESPAFLALFLAFVFVVSTMGIVLGSVARPYTVLGLENIEWAAKKAKKIEKGLRSLAIAVAAIFVAIALFTKV
jgi:hypothetical protein